MFPEPSVERVLESSLVAMTAGLLLPEKVMSMPVPSLIIAVRSTSSIKVLTSCFVIVSPPFDKNT